MHLHNCNVYTGVIDSGNVGTNFHSQGASVIRNTFAAHLEGHSCMVMRKSFKTIFRNKLL